MRFQFRIEDHDLECSVTVEGGYCGDRDSPPEGPEAVIESRKVLTYDPERPYYYHSLIYMLRGKRRRLLPAEVADKVVDYVLENHQDDILEQAGDEMEADMCEAADARIDAERDR